MDGAETPSQECDLEANQYGQQQNGEPGVEPEVFVDQGVDEEEDIEEDYDDYGMTQVQKKVTQSKY